MATEKTVCRYADIASMDSAMAEAFRMALQRLPANQAVTLRREQLEWFKQYARNCNAVASDVERKVCIVRHLSARTRQLKAQP